MGGIYRCAFVGLTSLLAVILLVIFLLFTDVGFSPSAWTEAHLDNGHIWAAKKLRVSAELAYYWRNTPRDAGKSESEDLVQQKEVKQSAIDSKVEGNFTESDGERNVSSKHGAEQVTKFDSMKAFLPYPKNVEPIHIHGSKHSPTTVTTGQTKSLVSHPKLHTTKKPLANDHKGKMNERWKNFAAAQASNTSEDTTIETATVEQKQRSAAEVDVVLEADADDFSEVDNIYNTEENATDEERNIQLAFMNEEKTISGTDFGNYTHIHSIKSELMEKASNIFFHMPCPKVYKSVPELVMAPWMKPLLSILSSFEGRHVTLVIANNAYRDVLLNWLISAKIVNKPPIENILVVSLDGNLYRLLQSRDIPSILAPFSTVLNSKHRFRRFFELIMMMRLGFMRLINRLGYDCAMYDIDAIILKNPQPLYEKWGSKDIVGSRGELPRELWRRWGVTICIGAVFIRSNPRTEIYWEAVHAVKLRGGPMANDQIRLNHGLHHLHVEWEHDRQTNRQRQQDQPALGRSPSSDLSVAVLPLSEVCRFDCRAEFRGRYYIWHKGGSRDKKSKMKGAKQGRTWFLKERWSELHANMVVDVKGTKWLRRISTGV